MPGNGESDFLKAIDAGSDFKRLTTLTTATRDSDIRKTE